MWRKVFSLLVLLLFVACANPAGTGTELIGGPAVVRVTGDSATVVWIVRNHEGSSGGEPFQVIRKSYSGLKPGATLTVQEDGLPATGQFKMPPAGPAEFEFVVFGDTRTRDAVHRRVVEAILKQTTPDFVLHTGDLVADGREADQWPVFFEIENPLLRRAAFFAALGNHEHNSRYFYQFFDLDRPYYSFDWGQAHFVVLMSDRANWAADEPARQRLWAEQLRWLEEDLAQAQQKAFRFAMMHHPPFTAVKRRQGSPNPTQDMVPLFEKYRVQAVFCGHDHNYQHHVVRGVHYIVTGGGGAPLYPVDAPLAGITRYVNSTEHYVRVRVQPARAVIEAVALNGTLLERVTIP